MISIGRYRIMPNYEQAPLLQAIGEKHRGKLGKAIRTHELEIAIFNCLGDRDIASIKLMLFLTGNAQDGTFHVAEKTVLDRCNISHKSYITARNKLKEKGWIKHENGSITIIYDKIY